MTTISRIIIPLFLFCILLTGCTRKATPQTVKVGMDASWFPLQLGEKENNVTAFATELLKEIGKVEKIAFIKITVNWDDLIDGLYQDQYAAILSSIPPYVFNEKLYDFSEVYLATGPVLIVPVSSPVDALKMLTNKAVAVLPSTNGALLLEKYPHILIRNYNSIPSALNDIVDGTLDGAIVDLLSAIAYCQDLYQGQLKIATLPLNNEGLRMISLHNKANALILHFNRGLDKLKASGMYDKLRVKWSLKEKEKK